MKKVPQTAEIVKVNYDSKSQISLEVQREHIVPKLNIKIKNQKQLDQAVEIVKLAEQWIANAEAFVNPVVDATHKAHKAAVQMRKDLTDKVYRPLGMLKVAIFDFVEEGKRVTRQKQLDADADQERINREAAEKAAKAATKAGADKETVAEIRDNVLATAAPLVRSVVEVPEEVSIRTTYDVDREDYDLYALAVAIAKLPKAGNHLLELIEPDFVNLRARAVAGKETAVIPGFKVVKKTGGSIR
jgi:hypothetical protein